MENFIENVIYLYNDNIKITQLLEENAKDIQKAEELLQKDFITEETKDFLHNRLNDLWKQRETLGYYKAYIDMRYEQLIKILNTVFNL